MAENLLGDFWGFVTDKVKTFPWDQVDDGIEALQKFKAGLKDHAPDIGVLEPHIQHLAPFAQLLDSPVTQLATSSIPLLSISVNLLKFYLKLQETEPTLISAVILSAQFAYIESLTAVLKQTADDIHLTQQLDSVSLIEILQAQLARQKSLTLTPSNAKRAISDFRASSLAVSFNQALRQQLNVASLSQSEIMIIIDRVSWGTQQYLFDAILKLKDEVEPLAEYLRLGGLPGIEKNNSILDYLETEIATLPAKSIFNDDTLTGQDLYVQLGVKPLNQEQKKHSGSHLSQGGKEKDLIFNIHDWVKQYLNTSDQMRKVLFIQGDAGRGKSLFCQMFANEVRNKLFPAFIPIIVRLRELQDLDNTLRGKLEMLLSTVDFVQSDPGWLTDRNTRFLLILDGFDELILQGQSTSSLRDFLDQVARFQQKSHHQCLITGRPLALSNSERKLVHDEFICAELLPMSDAQQSEWLAKWGEQCGQAEALAFHQFLQACPNDIKNRLAREPILLYLLGKLHNEGHLNAQIFKGTSGMQAKVRVYDESIHWVLDQQRQEIQRRLTGLETEDLREVLMEAALCIMQSGTEIASLKAIESRLTDRLNPVSELFKQAKQSTNQNNDQVLNNLLTSFYFKSGQAHQSGSIEFAHKSFSEFLFAERLKHSLQEWMQRDERNRHYKIREGEFARQIYDVLGYGSLRLEIMDYLRALLFDHPSFDGCSLFERLYHFYLDWSEGYYIDAPPQDNLPQLKMLQLQKIGIECGVREIDIQAGLNVMILLFELHQQAQTSPAGDSEKRTITFRPDADPHSAVLNGKKLRRIINYSECLDSAAFADIVGFALRYANLSEAELNCVRLTSADLSHANLDGAHLINAYMSFANLSHANMQCAKLSSAILFYTNLTQANLAQAVLYSAKLFGAKLIGANLPEADLLRANLTRANLTDAILTEANLNGAELCSAKFVNANLSNAKLERAILTDTELQNASLSYADLYKANLRNADLTGANLTHAILFRANVSGANFKNIQWDETTDWRDVKGLDQAKNISDDLKRHLGLL